MPYIRTRLSAPLTAEQELSLKSKLGKAVENLPGKTENWLMAEFCDNCRLWFAGDNSSPAAMVEVALFGKAPAAAYDKMTADLTAILAEELGIAPDRVYVKYEETPYWGWNGSNF